MRKSLMFVFSLALIVAMVFPTVAFAEPDPGTGTANIFIQNIAPSGNADITLNFTRGWGSGASPDNFSYNVSALGPGASKSLLYTNCWQANCTGTPVADGWAGAVELASSAPLATIVNLFWTGIPSAGTYSGVGAPSTTVYLPNLLKTATRRTIVSVQNTEATAATDVQMVYYNRNGTAVYTPAPVTIAANSVGKFDLSTIADIDFSATAGTGSLKITSSKKLAAVASIHYPAGSNGAAVYSGFPGGAIKVWLPSQFRRKGPLGNFTLFNANIIQNVGDQTANVTVNFIGKRATDANQSCTETIAPGASQGYNMATKGTASDACWTAIQALGDSWVGTVMVESTNSMPLAGVGFYFSTTNVNDVMAFEAIPDGTASNKLYAPAVYRKVKAGIAPASQQWSTTLVQNLDTQPVTVRVQFFSTAGTQVGGDYDIQIAGNGSIGVNLFAGVDLPQAALTALDASSAQGFNGGMVVSAPAGARLVGVTNIFYESPSGLSGSREMGAAYDAFPAP